MNLCEKMDGYVIQDLVDYCDKVMFEVFKGNHRRALWTNIGQLYILFYILCIVISIH